MKNKKISHSRLSGKRKRISKSSIVESKVISSAEKSIINIYDYDENRMEFIHHLETHHCPKYNTDDSVTWMNVDLLHKETIEQISHDFNIHYLITEDILTPGQRAKFEVIGDKLFAVMNMLYYNDALQTVEHEQISFVLCRNTLLTFQEEEDRDLFNLIREKIKIEDSKIRKSKTDYLFYSLLDAIVDNYFVVLEKIGEQIETVEENIIHNPNAATINAINHYRNEMILLKRYISPVRDLISNLLRSESDLIAENNYKYFKDVQDHIIQANDLVDNYRELLLNMQDLYLSQVNMKMNEIMKVLAIVTTLLAPLTVIVGIYGMNFKHMPELDSPYGYYACLALMGLIFAGMIFLFKKREWF